MINAIAGRIAQSIETVGDTVSEAFFEPVLRLGVTGLSRAGKTVFISALVHNLMEPGRMQRLRAVQRGLIRGAYLQPQPDMTLPRFDYEAHLASLTGDSPRWPDGTRAVSELRLSFRLDRTGLLGGLGGPRKLHLDIVDYPGEWLLDLGLMGKSYADWSAEVLARLPLRAEASAFRAALDGVDAQARHDESQAQELARLFTGYLTQARENGWSDCTPGRFLLPGDLAGSPVLTFAPLPGAEGKRGSLWREMARRFEGYKTQVIRPFFETHFARIDRQVVLIDVLEAVHRGPMALEDQRRAMAEVLASFRPGANGFFSSLLRGKRVEKILFAATKADHLHHSQHPRLTALAEAMLREARDRARFSGAETVAMSIAALRATVEETRSHGGQEIDTVRGRLIDGRQAAVNAGMLPEDPARLLAPAREGAQKWLQGDYGVMHFAPPVLSRSPGMGLPHIRLDSAAEFLIGDKLV
ncbi:YcjX family GTP-binding protein [Pararhodobacter zhoushanensis]|uniref:YcjX family protein n=1 Tax=Pararhodobacter zhoushanensis TaxID=2479545 RepID=A0ABT3H2S4_9RHOB|nr:YcjX family protein [Pararhodobacter zhoushanensis]MCW1934053.1 YcjX family protein [Pararhodobacter zhoushanensis]